MVFKQFRLRVGAALLVAFGLSVSNVGLASAAAPVVSNSEVAIYAQAGIYSATFKLGSLICNPEGSGSCTGSGGAAYQQNGDSFPAISVIWRFKIGAEGSWQTRTFACLASPAGSDSTWCGSNWNFSTLKLSNLTPGVAVFAQAALANDDGQSPWLNSSLSSGVAASATPSADVVVSKIWAANRVANRPGDAALTGDTFDFKASDLSRASSGVIAKYEWDLDGDGVFEESSISNRTLTVTWNTTGMHSVSLRLTSQGGETDTATQSFEIFAAPPTGEPGLSIIDGGVYTNTKSVKLSLVWPSYATEARISNDGGFATSKTKVVALASSVDWELDDSVRGIFTKVVYVRFNGSRIDTTKTYSDDIILDTTAPTINTSTAIATTSQIDVKVDATDDITGVEKLEIDSGTKIVSKDYSKSVEVSLSELNMVVSAASVAKASAQSLQFRVRDGAGNWTKWQILVLSGKSVAVASPSSHKTMSLRANKSVSGKSIAQFAKLTVSKNSQLAVKVASSSKKVCRAVGTSIRGLRAGTCKVTVSVKPKTGKAQSKTVSLRVS